MKLQFQFIIYLFSLISFYHLYHLYHIFIQFLILFFYFQKNKKLQINDLEFFFNKMINQKQYFYLRVKYLYYKYKNVLNLYQIIQSFIKYLQ